MEDLTIDLAPIYDIVFKNLFGEKKNKDFIIDFLNSILNREKNDSIIDIEYIKTGNTPIPVNEGLAKQNKRKREDDKSKNIKDVGRYGDMDILVKNISGIHNLKYNNNENNNDDNNENNNDDNNENNNDDNNENNNDDNNENEKNDNNIVGNTVSNEDSNSDIDKNEHYENYKIIENDVENFRNKAKYELDSLLSNIKEEINNYVRKTIIEFNNENTSEDIDDEKLKTIMNKNKDEINKFLSEILNDKSYKLFKFETNMINTIISKFCEINDEGIIVKAKTYSNEYINIEIQIERSGNMFKRTLYYAAGIIFQSLPRANPYDDIPKLIMINILNYEEFNKNDTEKKKYHWIFTFKEKYTNEEKDFEDLLNIHFIELPKYKGLKQDILEKEYPWILLLNDPNNDFFKKKATPRIFKEARNELLNLQKQPGFSKLYEERLKRYRDYISELKKTKEEGIEIGEKIGIEKGEKIGIEKGEKIGIEKGEKIGIEKGKRKNEIETIFNLLNVFPLESVLNLNYSEEEVECIYKFINGKYNYNIEMLSEELKYDKDELLEIYNNSQELKNKNAKRVKV